MKFIIVNGSLPPLMKILLEWYSWLTYSSFIPLRENELLLLQYKIMKLDHAYVK